MCSNRVGRVKLVLENGGGEQSVVIKLMMTIFLFTSALESPRVHARRKRENNFLPCEGMNKIWRRDYTHELD